MSHTSKGVGFVDYAQSVQQGTHHLESYCYEKHTVPWDAQGKIAHRIYLINCPISTMQPLQISGHSVGRKLNKLQASKSDHPPKKRVHKRTKRSVDYYLFTGPQYLNSLSDSL